MSDRYFEARNGDNVFQFGDTTHLMRISDKKQIVVQAELGEIYGVELADGVVSISYSTTNSTLFISPITKYNGKRIQYVTSSSSAPINIFYWTEDFFEPMEHGTGIELRNANGDVVFNNRGYLGSFIGSYYTNVTTAQSFLVIDKAPLLYKNCYMTKGLSAFYMAMCAKSWGVYHISHVKVHGKGGWLGGQLGWKESTYVDDGYCFAGPNGILPGDRVDVITPDAYTMYTTGVSSFIEGEIEVSGDKASPYDPAHPPDPSRTCSDEQIQVFLSNEWKHLGAPSSSVMAPLSIWLPAILATPETKNTVRSVGYVFETKKNARTIRIDSGFSTLPLKSISGVGSLEHLNHTINEQTISHVTKVTPTAPSTTITNTGLITEGVTCDVSMVHIVSLI